VQVSGWSDPRLVMFSIAVHVEQEESNRNPLQLPTTFLLLFLVLSKKKRLKCKVTFVLIKLTRFFPTLSVTPVAIGKTLNVKSKEENSI